MSYTVKYTKPEKKEPVKYVLMQEEPKKIKVDVSNNKKNPKQEPLKNSKTIYQRQSKGRKTANEAYRINYRRSC